MSLQGGLAKGHKSLRRVASLPCAVQREGRTMRQQCMARGIKADDMKVMALLIGHFPCGLRMEAPVQNINVD